MARPKACKVRVVKDAEVGALSDGEATSTSHSHHQNEGLEQLFLLFLYVVEASTNSTVLVKLSSKSFQGAHRSC